MMDPAFKAALQRFYQTGDTSELDALTAKAPQPSSFGAFVPPDLAVPEIGDWVRSEAEAARHGRGGLLPVTTTDGRVNVANPSLEAPGWATTAMGMVAPPLALAMKAAPYIDPNAGIVGTTIKALKSPGAAYSGDLKLPAPGAPREWSPETPFFGAADPNSIFGRLGIPVSPVRTAAQDEAYEPVFDLAGLVMGGALPGASAVSKAGEVALGVVPVDAAKAFRIKSNMPQANVFRAAVENTPGASFDPDGAVRVAVRRSQKPEQEMEASVRGGVFYLPEGRAARNQRYYFDNTNTMSYGGSDRINGETAFKAPLVVKGATGGKMPENAYTKLHGGDKSAYAKMRTDSFKVVDARHMPGGVSQVEFAEQFLREYAPEMVDQAASILRHSTIGNRLPYALQEAAIASALRRAGHDGAIGYSVGRDRKPFLSEVFDVRERMYPGTRGEFEIWPESQFGPRDVTLGSGDTSGSGQLRTAGLLGLDQSRMELGRELAIQKRNRGIPTGKDAPGWDRMGIKRDPEPGTPEWDQAVARAEQRAAQPSAESPLMTQVDAAAVTDPAFVAGRTAPRLPVSETGQAYLSLLDSFEKPSQAPVTRDVTLGSGDTGGTGQLRTTALLGAKDRGTGLYSALERAVDAMPEQRSPGQQWLNTITNKAGVKPEELEWTGLRSFLEERRGQPVTKADIADHLEANRVRLDEVRKTKAGDIMGREQTRYADYQLPGGENYREAVITLPQRITDPSDAARFLRGELNGDPAKFGFDTPQKLIAEAQRRGFVQGGDRGMYKSAHWDETNPLAHIRMNERIMGAPTSATIDDIGRRMANSVQEGLDPANMGSGAAVTAVKKGAVTPAEAAEYSRAKGWRNEDAPWANERLGKRSLHLEEIQSDWHQAGRKQGYDTGPKVAYTVVEGGYQRGHYLTRQEAEAAAQEMGGGQVKEVPHQGVGVPDAPFKKTWHELALKRALVDAAERGYDRLSWTPGAAQAERYDLSKQVDNLMWSPEGRRLEGFKDGKSIFVHGNVGAEQLPDMIGKEAADKLINKPSRVADLGRAKLHTLEGVDLKVGGSGMEGFYDKMVPQALEKLTKQWGVKVRQTPAQSDSWGIFGKDGRQISPDFETAEKARQWGRQQPWAQDPHFGAKVRMTAEETPPLWYIDIPEKMRADIREHGFALFQEGQRAGAPLVIAKEVQKNEQATAGTAARSSENLAALTGDVTPATAAVRGGLGRGIGRGRSMEEVEAMADKANVKRVNKLKLRASGVQLPPGQRSKDDETVFDRVTRRLATEMEPGLVGAQ